MSNERLKQEVKEAMVAGQIALSSLQIAAERLDCACSRGIWGRLGDGLCRSLQKNTRLDDATYYMESAKQNLLVFRGELQKVHVSETLKGKIQVFLSFTDFLFDGLEEDYQVQSKISQARAEIMEAINRVESLLGYLRKQYDKLQESEKQG